MFCFGFVFSLFWLFDHYILLNRKCRLQSAGSVFGLFAHFQFTAAYSKWNVSRMCEYTWLRYVRCCNANRRIAMHTIQLEWLFCIGLCWFVNESDEWMGLFNMKKIIHTGWRCSQRIQSFYGKDYIEIENWLILLLNTAHKVCNQVLCVRCAPIHSFIHFFVYSYSSSSQLLTVQHSHK